MRKKAHTLLFSFDENWKLVDVLLGAETDTEEAKLQELADKMIKPIRKENVADDLYPEQEI